MHISSHSSVTGHQQKPWSWRLDLSASFSKTLPNLITEPLLLIRTRSLQEGGKHWTVTAASWPWAPGCALVSHLVTCTPLHSLPRAITGVAIAALFLRGVLLPLP